MSEFRTTILTDESGSIDALFAHIDELIAAGARSLCLFACDANGFTPELLDDKLKSLPIPVFGGIFPQIISTTKNLERGSLVCGLEAAVTVDHVYYLSDPDADYAEQAEPLTEHLPEEGTVIILVDGLSKRIAAFLEEVYEELGSEHHYLGGGTGSLSFQQKPSIFSNQGLLQDCAQITALDLPANIGVEHGWQKFAGPFLVTGSHENTITTLDYRPAFEVYREVVERDAGLKFNDDNFFDIAKAYPFGLDRLGSEVIVRDPLMQKDNELVCVGEVPENNLAFILKGEAEHLLAASKQAATEVAEDGELHNPAIFFDCISRVLFLQERFSEEMQGITQQLPEHCSLIGALTLGEIADSGNICLEFYNKTAVLGAFLKED